MGMPVQHLFVQNILKFVLNGFLDSYSFLQFSKFEFELNHSDLLIQSYYFKPLYLLVSNISEICSK